MLYKILTKVNIYIILILFVGCQSEQKQESKINMCKSHKNYNINITFKGISNNTKPGLLHLVFDMLIENNERSAKWFVFPNYITIPKEKLKNNSVHTLSIDRLVGKGCIFVAEFLGTHGLFIIKVPAQAKIVIKKFIIPSFSEWEISQQNNFSMEVVVAEEIMIANQQLNKWAKDKFITSQYAEVDFSDFKAKKLQKEISTKNSVEICVQFITDCTHVFDFDIDKVPF